MGGDSELDLQLLSQCDGMSKNNCPCHTVYMSCVCVCVWLCRRTEASGKPKTEHVPKRVSSFRRSESPSSLQDMDGTDFGGTSGSYSFNHGPPPAYSQAGMHAGLWLLASAPSSPSTTPTSLTHVAHMQTPVLHVCG